jgi:UDP-N-acetylmuramoyl-L-alanyl-D-glutamate--2,6-diaminopimelate ligase
VIGVTGTKGKTTTSHLITHILDHAGFMVGMATTVRFRIGRDEWVNDTKQTMLGRLGLQRLLFRMAMAGCSYAVVETSSEGILQYRHRFVAYKTAVFTNLSPEHIERHGSFENYRAAKVKLFAQVAKRKDGVAVLNLDDSSASYFLAPPVATKLGYRLTTEVPARAVGVTELKVERMVLSSEKSEFDLGGVHYEMPLLGEMNVRNAATAILVAMSENVPAEVIQSALKTAKPAPGRLEIVDRGQDFTVVVDYAHEPASLEAVYATVKIFRPKRIIGILGSQGGGRDKWKRAAMGIIAGTHADTLILTNEDPYDEDPMRIIDDVAQGAEEAKLRKPLEILKIVDRAEAIRKAISLAKAGDAVVVTGKGGEVWMCVAGDKKIAWSDRKIVEEALADKEL